MFNRRTYSPMTLRRMFG